MLRKRGRAPARQATASSRPAAGAPLASIRGGLVVAATRVGDAAVSILGEGREASRQKAEPKEGGERQCEGTFHDPSPFCVRDQGGRWAYRSAGEASHVRTTHAFAAHPHIVAGVDGTKLRRPKPAGRPFEGALVNPLS